MNNGIMTLDGVCEFLHMTSRQVKYKMKHEGLPYTGTFKDPRFIKDDVVAWLRGEKKAGPSTLPETDPFAGLKKEAAEAKIRREIAENKQATQEAEGKMAEPQDIEALREDIKTVGNYLSGRLDALESLSEQDNRLKPAFKELAVLVGAFIRLLREKPETAEIVEKVEKRHPDYFERMHMRANLGGQGDRPAWR